MTDQPKPATGEWTAGFVSQLYCTLSPWQNISDAHNAALAAEREKVQPLVELLQELQDESAVERTSRNYVVVQITTSTWDKLLAKVKEGK